MTISAFRTTHGAAGEICQEFSGGAVHPSVPRHTDGADHQDQTHPKARPRIGRINDDSKPHGRHAQRRSTHVRNRRLYDAIDQWAFCALTTSPGARAFYDQHRTAGDTHHQALRALGNRLVGILHGCLRHHSTYDEHKAWSHRQTDPQTQAA